MHETYDTPKPSQERKAFMEKLKEFSRKYPNAISSVIHQDIKDILPRYVVCVKTADYPEGEPILIEVNDFNSYKYEPICGDDNREQAEKKLAEVREFGIKGYLDKQVSSLKTKPMGCLLDEGNNLLNKAYKE